MNAPACTSVEISPSSAACAMMSCEVGITCSENPSATRRPFRICAAIRRSSSRPLAQLPR